MNLYDFLVTSYNSFVSVFPAPLQWLVTLLILIGILGAIMALLRHHVLLIIVVVLLLPFIVPVIVSLATDSYHFIVFLLRTLHLSAI